MSTRSGPTKAQLAGWRALRARTSSILSTVDQDYLHVVLQDYWTSRDVDRLVLCLLLALETPAKLTLLSDIRDLLDQRDAARFDKIAPTIQTTAEWSDRASSPYGSRLDSSVTSESSHRRSGLFAGASDSGSPVTRIDDRSASDLQPERRRTSVTHVGESDEDFPRAGAASPARPAASFGARSVTLERANEDTELGFNIFGGSEHNTGVFISSVDTGSAAESSGLSIGDRILAVNGADMQRARHSSVARALRGPGRINLLVRASGRGRRWTTSRGTTPGNATTPSR